ncbi:MAG: hypothetical protein ACXAC7_15970 [Candidatus Hodarchaeales archaeon]|jgi:predicted transcriptional regulator
MSNKNSSVILIKPTKLLNTGDIFGLPHHLHSTILALLSIEEGTIEEISQECESNSNETAKNLTSLQEMGFVGKKRTKGIVKFFCAY